MFQAVLLQNGVLHNPPENGHYVDIQGFSEEQDVFEMGSTRRQDCPEGWGSARSIHNVCLTCVVYNE